MKHEYVDKKYTPEELSNQIRNINASFIRLGFNDVLESQIKVLIETIDQYPDYILQAYAESTLPIANSLYGRYKFIELCKKQFPKIEWK